MTEDEIDRYNAEATAAMQRYHTKVRKVYHQGRPIAAMVVPARPNEVVRTQSAFTLPSMEAGSVLLRGNWRTLEDYSSNLIKPQKPVDTASLHQELTRGQPALVLQRDEDHGRRITV